MLTIHGIPKPQFYALKLLSDAGSRKISGTDRGAGCQNVRLYRIDDEHCNPYRIWKEMGSPENMNPQEIHEVIEKSSLVAEKVTYTYENGELIVSGRLQVNDTHCYIIRK